jgi:glycosyltransferase involved in cell wall biosynthesis
MTRRIAFLLPSLAGGGAERVTLNLAGGMVGRGLAVDLVLFRAAGPNLDWVPDGVRVIDLGCRRYLASLRPLTLYMRQERPLALISALTHANLYALAARRLACVRSRVVVGVHAAIPEMRAEMSGVKARHLRPALIRLLYRDADCIVVVSRGAAESFRASFRNVGARVRVIYNPVLVPALFALAKEPVEHPWLSAGEPPFLLAVGRLAPQKDFSTLIRAFAEMRRRRPDRPARLLILGEGEERPLLERLVAEIGCGDDVQLPGYADNPYAYMAAARGVVLASRYEGLPTVLIEALALGTPVVSTDCPGGSREILQDGRWGCLTPVGDVSALARAMGDVLDGHVPPPPDANDLAPYRLDSAVDQYLQAIDPSLVRDGAMATA